MDGTLLNSDELVLKIYRELTDIYQPKNSLSSVLKEDLLAKSYLEVVKMLYEDNADFYVSKIQELHKKYKASYLKLFPGTLTFLKHLKRKGYLLGLVTSEMRDIAVDELKMMGIYHFFDTIITFDDVSKPKPDPEGILKAITILGVQKHEVLWIGDQKSDGIAGQRADVFTSLIARNKQKRHIKSFFDFTFKSYQDIEHFLDQASKPLCLYKDDKPYTILQLTDLHLMHDEKDEKTFQLIDTMISNSHPDFIVFTGDQTMSPDARLLYEQLRNKIDAYRIPYSYVFGNHDTEDGVKHHEINRIMNQSKNLYFKKSPSALGYSNYVIELRDHQHTLLWLFIMLDSHIDQTYMIHGKPSWGYGSLSLRQQDWYENTIRYYQKLEQKIIPSLVFMHIPLAEYRDVDCSSQTMTGEKNENVSAPPMSDGFFDLMKKHKSTKAMFVGHDHLNDFSFIKDHIMLAYGRVSGFYEYAMPGFPKGARVITLFKDTFETKVTIYNKS
jgi:HAD superfamily hydrolase (TIGR01509 family)